MVLSLLARSKGWGWSEGRGNVWALSFRLGTYLGDSKKGTRKNKGEVCQSEGQEQRRKTAQENPPMSESLWFFMISPSSK